MNPRSVGDFLKSKFGLFLLFIMVLFGGLWIYSGQQASARDAARHAAPPKKGVELGQVQIPLDQGLESGVPQQVKAQAARPTDAEGEPAGLVPFRPTPPPRARSAPASVPTTAAAAAVRPEERSRKIRYTPMLASYQAPAREEERLTLEAPTVFIPFGTLLKCKLVNTVDSANIDTPIIALVLEDVWQNGKQVLPANTLIHGTAKAGRLRDRVNAQGAWRLVWHDGRELSFSGTALDRVYDQEVDGYGITDGSAGIRGRVLATEDLQELKMLAAAALSGFARGTQDRTHNALGTTIAGSVSSGVREGFGEVFELYAHRTLREIEEQGYFVRIPAGKEFYVYVLETVDTQKAAFGVRHSAMPAK